MKSLAFRRTQFFMPAQVGIREGWEETNRDLTFAGMTRKRLVGWVEAERRYPPPAYVGWVSLTLNPSYELRTHRVCRI